MEFEIFVISLPNSKAFFYGDAFVSGKTQAKTLGNGLVNCCC